MQKPTKYDWKDSNMAAVGSDEDHAVKKESAQGEPAWKGSGQVVGVEVMDILFRVCSRAIFFFIGPKTQGAFYYSLIILPLSSSPLPNSTFFRI